MKKGFTLIEIITVVVIFAFLIGVITVPIINQTKEKKEQDKYVEQLEKMLSSLKEWAEKNQKQLPATEEEVLVITLGQLKSDGILTEISNPTNDEYFEDSIEFIIRKEQETYVYAIDESTVTTRNSKNNSPKIKLSGNILQYYSIGDVYTEEGYVAYDEEEKEIDDISIIPIGLNLKENLQEEGIYNILYEATDNKGIKTYAMRTVIVK